MFKKVSTNFAWFMVVLGGVVECFWVSGLKHSSEIWHYIFTMVGVCISFACMLKACEVLEVSIVYSVFVGIGTAGVVLNEMLIFNEPISIIKLILITILLLSVVGLKFTSKES
ncbi:multidrug efflux SMR transporter [Campylobacter sp.]|uniref:DMT family transporter n=1 Tax=Campylobacter sp. TaxID=205 RepID=UPI0025BED3E7|nr:multidrug efflux SMR transporter [Campylobacter sp.]